MKEKEAPLDSAFIDEYRLEIQNRMKNLFWTVCGDYHTQVSPDLDFYRENPDAAIYETIRYGAFSKYFHADEVAIYIWKKTQKGGNRDILMMLFHVCMDLAVLERLSLERKGVREMREMAEPDIEKEKTRLQKEIFPEKTEEEFWKAVSVFGDTQDTESFIRNFDHIYNHFFDPVYERKHGSLKEVINYPVLKMADDASREALTDEQMEEIIKKYLDNLKKEMMRIRRKKQKSGYIAGQISGNEQAQESMDSEAAKKVKDYVMQNYGKSCISEREEIVLHHRYCQGMHVGCSLHFTEGILHDPVLKNNQYRFSQLQLEKNRLHYYNNHRIVKRNITDLADILQKALIRKADAESTRAVSGQIIPERLWKIGRTDDEKLFDRKNPVSNQEYVLDILLDSSGSQAKRQPQVAIQGYILSEALSRVKIPHRVMGFCSFWDYMVLRRYRDYEDDADKNMRLFEFRASGSNRDGLAIKVAGHALMERPETNRILIVLSDGKPCDVPTKRPGTQAVKLYQGDEAVRDAALSVRDLRSKGITVLGIFSGNEEDIGSEKKIYGKDFAYIRELRSFSKVVGTYLKRQIESEE